MNEASLPYILHWNQNHFVVCYNVRKRRNDSLQFQIADPASQLLTYNQQEFCKCWLGKSQPNESDQSCSVSIVIYDWQKFNNI